MQIFQEIRKEIQKVIIGQDDLIHHLLIALLVEGHVLLEGVPGLAKTRTLLALAKTLNFAMNRVQFTPDLLPSDIIWTEVYRTQTGEFLIRRGPIFCNLLSADEINRAPAKVQSALLEAMAEKKVTIAGDTIPLPSPFVVLATQNPIEQTGTFELPEAQLDRFLFKLIVNYPSAKEEEAVVFQKLQSLSDQDFNLNIVSESAILLSEKTKLFNVHIDERLITYIVRLVSTTRDKLNKNLSSLIQWGASPRASIALALSARANAYLNQRDYILPEDIHKMIFPVLRHRILLSFGAIGEGVSPDDVITKLLKEVKAP